MIKAHIKKQNITQSDFAKKANISRQLLNWHLKNPERTWKHKAAVRVVRAIYGEPIREKVVELILGNIK